jgi:hypothetical protein
MADLSSSNLHRRAASAEECRLAGRHWVTFAEAQPLAPSRPPPAVVPLPTARAVDLTVEP